MLPIRSRKRATQPQNIAQIDWSNPITRGLIFAQNGNRDVVSQATLSGSFTESAFYAGKCLVGNGSTTGGRVTYTGSAPSAVTLMALAKPTNQTATNTLVGLGTTLSTDYILMDLSGTETNDPLRVLFNNAGSGTKSFTYASPPYNVWSMFAGIAYSGATVNRGFLNGRELTASSSAGTATMPTPAYCEIGQLTTNTTSNRLTGNIGFSAIWNRALSVNEIKSISANPWQIFKARKQTIFASISSSILLYLNNLSQAQSVSTPTLTQQNVLDVQNLGQAQIISSVSLTQQNILAVAAISQGQQLTNITLAAGITLNLTDIQQDQALSIVDLVQQNILALGNITQNQTIDVITLNTGLNLDISNILQSQLLTSVNLTQQNVLQIQDALQVASLSSPNLSQQNTLSVASLLQSQVIQNIVLVEDEILVVSDLLHSQLLSTLTLQASTFTAIPKGELIFILGSSKNILVLSSNQFTTILS